MKRIYFLFLCLLTCLMLPLKGYAVSQAELLNSDRYLHVDSSVDSGRGDGKYLDLSSVKPVIGTEWSSSYRSGHLCFYACC